MRHGLVLGILTLLAGGLGAQGAAPDPAVEVMARNAAQDFFADTTLRDYGSIAVLALEGDASMALALEFANAMEEEGQGVIGPVATEQALVSLNLPPRQLPVSQDLTDLFDRLGNDAFCLVEAQRLSEVEWSGTVQLLDPAAGGFPWVVNVAIEFANPQPGPRRSMLQEHPEYVVIAVIAVLLIGFLVRRMRGRE